MDRFLALLNEGHVKIDFDSRTGHNHGTKCRIKQQYAPQLYAEATVVLDAPRLK